MRFNLSKKYDVIDVDDLKKKKFMIATPMYGGSATNIFVESVMNVAKIATAHGIPFMHYFLGNESLITRARNYCVDYFLRSDCTHLVFIDADIGFNPMDLLYMVHLTEPVGSTESPYNVVCGAYPKKGISWEKVKKAVDKGLADVNPNELEEYIGDFAFNLLPGQDKFDLTKPAKIRHAATGFLCIHRSVFEQFKQKYPEMAYTPDHTRTSDFNGERKIHCFFDTGIDPESNHYLSEDYWFSEKINKMGIPIWLCPWMALDHMGTYVFKGNLPKVITSGSVHSTKVKKK